MSAQPPHRPRVLFVCTGNTCRSPFAAAVARRHGLDASSAGLDVHEPRAGGDAIAAARARGVDLSRHTARPLTDEALAAADVVVAMTDAQVRLLPRARVLGDGIPDPYGRGPEAYSGTYDRIERAVDALAAELR